MIDGDQSCESLFSTANQCSGISRVTNVEDASPATTVHTNNCYNNCYNDQILRSRVYIRRESVELAIPGPVQSLCIKYSDFSLIVHQWARRNKVDYYRSCTIKRS